jgi:hypothetical protein
MRGNKRALELHQNLGKLPEQLADDEHGQDVLALGGGDRRAFICCSA